jgi:hypothetical protein
MFTMDTLSNVSNRILKLWVMVAIVVFSGLSSTIFQVNDVSATSAVVPQVSLHIQPFDTIYEGDIIDCTITGEVSSKYWMINNQSNHVEFYDDDPIIYDPEPTPLDSTYVSLTVYAENEYGNDSDTVPIKLKRIFFGDIHWHTHISDGHFTLDEMYQNTIEDNYLDFAACTDHGELIDGFNTKFGGVPRWDWVKTLLQKILRISEWELMKEKAIEYYEPGRFTTLLGFEWTAAQWSIGGKEWSPHGWEDVGHINFYYKDIYSDAPEYGYWEKINYDGIFTAMADEWDKGHLNIGFPHHPQGKASWVSFTTNFTFLADGMSHALERNKILRGAEIYSRWGSAIGQHYTPGVPWLWRYPETQFYNQTDAWAENACWEWSDDTMRNQRFVFIASSDTHDYNRPGSALINDSHLGVPSGMVGVYAVHNTRKEIWEGLNEGDCYALQLLKIRAHVGFDGKLAYGRWINCSSPVEIQVTARSTFSGIDHGGKAMCPHGYREDELEYPIDEIWVVKKDRERGRPWCKVIGHATLRSHIAAVTFTDPLVQPGDFYWIAIKQKGDRIAQGGDEYMVFLGPVFINQVT